MNESNPHDMDAFDTHEDEARLEDHTHPGDDLDVEIIDLDAPDIEDAASEFVPSAGVLGIELPDDPRQAQDLLLVEVMRARQEGGEYLESLQRVAAEYDNFRRRAERDQADLTLRGTQRLVEAMLPTLDAFDAALAYEPQGPGEEKLLAGMQGTYNQLMETLGRNGLEVIPAVGTEFDPAVHEAVAGGGDGDLVVSQVLRTGYRLADRVVRPSLVMVDTADGAAAVEPEDVHGGAGDGD